MKNESLPKITEEQRALLKRLGFVEYRDEEMWSKNAPNIAKLGNRMGA
jgi:hypothetical protein